MPANTSMVVAVSQEDTALSNDNDGANGVSSGTSETERQVSLKQTRKSLKQSRKSIYDKQNSSGYKEPVPLKTKTGSEDEKCEENDTESPGTVLRTATLAMQRKLSLQSLD